MQRGALLSRLRASSGPALRVVGLTYTGLCGMLALTLIVSVALVPVGPALQQVAEPARQAVSNLVQPTSDAVTVFLGGAPAIHVQAAVVPPTRVSGFSDVVSLDVTIEDPIEATPVEEPIPVVAVPAVMREPSAEPESATAEPVDEIVELEPIEVSAPHPLAPVVVQPAPTAGLQIASTDAPKALPTLVPTETALQVKARLDAENQAAIDAAKAAQVRAKAEADAANNAAIAALKAATATAPVSTPVTVTAIPTPTGNSVTAPTGKTSDSAAAPKATATATATAQSKAAANAANQAAIDAAKLAQVRAKAEANSANQAAQAAKDSRSATKATPTATAQPTPAMARPPVAQSTAASATPATKDNRDSQGQGHAIGTETVDREGDAESQAAAASADGGDAQGNVGDVGDQALLENVPVDQAQTSSDAGAA